jgi:tetratricopeptide (TPR) repeat protein
MTKRSAPIVLLLLVGGVALAAADDEERARSHYEAGRVQYNLGDYKGAVHEFAAGYKLQPRPEFLVNLGQAYRRLGELERAREMYERFLAEAPADDHARPQVRTLIAEVDRELARVHAATPPPATGTTGEPGTTTSLTPVPELSGEPATTTPPRKSFARRNWWIFPVAGVVLVGITIGIVYAARPTSNAPDCTGASLGCLPLN